MSIDLAQIEPVRRSEHGDQRPLIELLRSDVPLCQLVRQYIATELENESKKRFIQKSKRDLGTECQDHRMFEQVRYAKQQLIIRRLGAEAAGRWDEWQSVSNTDGLDWLAANGISVDPNNLDNALRRNKGKWRAGL